MAAACEYTGAAPSQTDNATTAGQMVNGTDGPRVDLRGGRRLSDHADAVGVLSGSTSREPDEGNTNRRLRLLATPSVSVLSYGELRELVKAQIRRECRHWGFDWDDFIADGPEWGIVEIVHRRAVQQERGRNLDVRPTDIPTDTVLTAVRDVMAEWDAEPSLRPCEADFLQEQARRGEKGRETQQALAEERAAQVMGLVASGVTNNAEIGRRLGINRSTVGRIRTKADAAARRAALSGKPEFPALDMPAHERWPVVQFIKQTGVGLDLGDACWLAGIGQCYEAEGREDELMAAIRVSAGDGIKDPWAYLQRCIINRGDAWTVDAQLLGDVVAWAGEDSLRYALTAIGGGYVRRPVAYLKRTLQYAVGDGRRRVGRPDRPVAMAVAMAKELAPELVVVGGDDAVVMEDVDQRSGYIESFRRRFGRLPWEDEPAVGGDDLGGDVGDVGGWSDCCIGLNRVGDDSRVFTKVISCLESSPGYHKADATAVVDRGSGRSVGPGRHSGASGGGVGSETPFRSGGRENGPETTDFDHSDEIRRSESHGEAVKRGTMTSGTLPRGNRVELSERGRCRHPLAALLATAMVLEAVVEVECAAGCGHRLYSDRGLFECPCHWSTSKVAQVALELQREPTAVCTLPSDRSACADVRTNHGH